MMNVFLGVSSQIPSASNKPKGSMDLHREHYLIECISAEGNVDLDVIKQLLKKS